MNKELFIALCNQIENNVHDIRWIDADDGQLNTMRPPVAFPCVLVDMTYPQCESLNAGSQRIRAQFTLRIAFQSCGATNSAAPEEVRSQALARLDTLEEIHKALNWWNYDRQISPLRRLRVTTERRQDGYKVYQMVYETQFIE